MIQDKWEISCSMNITSRSAAKKHSESLDNNDVEDLFIPIDLGMKLPGTNSGEDERLYSLLMQNLVSTFKPVSAMMNLTTIMIISLAINNNVLP
ncbi:hypothetical protein L6452_20171 [Arctium lappa]|uniref:Uncharacterized protein n=1 Tax=Arctium lappa TaxID=4217 RepID=A0ACB9BBZ2_ARCLA|nr:hypothetical protein L6452_20171 [Arctium lappa]